MPGWTLDPEKFGRDIEIAMTMAGLRPVDVATRLYGENERDKRSGQTRMSEWVAGRGLNVKQLALVFGLMRESPEARDYLLQAVGVSIPEAPAEIADSELREWLEEARYTFENRDDAAARTVMGTLREINGMIKRLRHLLRSNGG